MAITNSIRKTLPGTGTPGLANVTASSTTIAANAITVTSTLPSGKTLNFAEVRIKVSGVDATHAISAISITQTDGTTTENAIPAVSHTGTNGQGSNFVFQTASDLNVTAMTTVVTFSVGVTAATVDVEVFGN